MAHRPAAVEYRKFDLAAPWEQFPKFRKAAQQPQQQPLQEEIQLGAPQPPRAIEPVELSQEYRKVDLTAPTEKGGNSIDIILGKFQHGHLSSS